MSLIDRKVSKANGSGRRSLPNAGSPLHRVGLVRCAEGISSQILARRLNITVSELGVQELETCDMLLSRLYAWQRALDIPVAELLIESGDPLSLSVAEQAQLVRLMKTALSILEVAKQRRVHRMAQNMVELLTQMMPTLKDVSAWPETGLPRRSDELGVAAHRRLSQDVFLDLVD